MRILKAWTGAALLISIAARDADAQTPGVSAPGQSAAPNGPLNPNTQPAPGTGSPFVNQLLTESNLFGDMGGVRSWAGARGVTYGINETSEVLGNPVGGTRQGADYEGLTTISAGLDTDKAFGWKGGTFNVSALWIHGRDLATDDLDNINTPSGIEAERAFRLWELWYDQVVADGAADIKIGQQSIDQEFLTSSYSSLFINTMMGWPVVPSYDMYAGGPAYPLSSLGVRFRASKGPLTGLIGVYDDNPSGGPFDDDDQLRGAERTGTAFNLNTGALVIGELQWAVNQPSTGQNVSPNAKPAGLPGTYRIGAWYDSGNFPDQRFDANGVSLADPSSTGDPKLLRHDYAAYLSADQMVWEDKAQVRSVGVFLRMEGAPPDRNLISFGLNTGISLKAPFLSRPTDTVGIGYGLARVSGDASELDQDTASFDGDAAYPIRSSESFLEVTYQAQIAPWWQVQPDAQYVFNPGGGIPNPENAGGASTPRVSNEAILGVRTNITF